MGDYVTVPVRREPGQLAAPVLFPQRKPTLQDIQKLQGVCSTLPQVETEAKHYFAPGVYGRELFMPAGVLIIGKIHRVSHLVVMAYGDVSVYTEGHPVRRMRGYNAFVSDAGAKRVIYPHADTLWITAHGTAKTDLDDIEAEIIEPDNEDAIKEYARLFRDAQKELGV